MPNSEKKCGIWGNLIAGDVVVWTRTNERYKIAKADSKKVPKGHAPIKPEEPNPFDKDLILFVPIDDIERV